MHGERRLQWCGSRVEGHAHWPGNWPANLQGVQIGRGRGDSMQLYAWASGAIATRWTAQQASTWKECEEPTNGIVLAGHARGTRGMTPQ